MTILKTNTHLSKKQLFILFLVDIEQKKCLTMPCMLSGPVQQSVKRRTGVFHPQENITCTNNQAQQRFNYVCVYFWA